MPENRSVHQQAFFVYKKNIGALLPMCAIYGTIVLLCFLLAYFFPYTLIISVPLIVVPFTFALQSSSIMINNIKDSKDRPISTFFKSYFTYYKSTFKGGYRTLIGLIKALSTYAVIYSLILIPICIAAYFSIDELQEIVKNNASYSYEQMEAIINNNNLLKYGAIFANGAGLLSGAYFFIHHIFAHSLIYSSLFHSPTQIPMRDNSYMFRSVFSYFRKTFYKEYYKSIWWLIIVYVIFYCIGFSLILLLKTDINSCSPQIVGLAVAFLANLVFIPYVFYVIESIFLNNIKGYDNACMKATMELLDVIKSKANFSKEEEEEFNKTVDLLKNKDGDSSQEDKNK